MLVQIPRAPILFPKPFFHFKLMLEKFVYMFLKDTKTEAREKLEWVSDTAAMCVLEQTVPEFSISLSLQRYKRKYLCQNTKATTMLLSRWCIC